jgi:hypothetical protein
MFEMTDFKENVLAITDEQVAADWRLGLLRALGKVARYARPNDSMGSYGVTVPGSNREHVMGNFGGTIPSCTLVEIYDIREEKGEDYNFSTFGGSTNDVIILSANATCACGRIVKHPVSMNIDPGELIYEALHADED